MVSGTKILAVQLLWWCSQPRSYQLGSDLRQLIPLFGIALHRLTVSTDSMLSILYIKCLLLYEQLKVTQYLSHSWLTSRAGELTADCATIGVVDRIDLDNTAEPLKDSIATLNIMQQDGAQRAEVPVSNGTPLRNVRPLVTTEFYSSMLWSLYLHGWPWGSAHTHCRSTIYLEASSLTNGASLRTQQKCQWLIPVPRNIYCTCLSWALNSHLQAPKRSLMKQ